MLECCASQNMVHIVEATVGRRYAGWFIRNTEHAQRVLDGVRDSPLPSVKTGQTPAAAEAENTVTPAKAGPKVTWGKVSA